MVNVHSPTDVLSKEIWRRLKDLKDPVLKEMVNKLPETIMASQENATTGKYMGAFRWWKVWTGR